jgi:Zn finger protein HypA/HybF involved in hydrogenase expression
MINIQHPDITRIERTGHPFVVTEYRYAECAKCGKAIDEEQSAYNLCAACEKKRGSVLSSCFSMSLTTTREPT